jgi:acetoin utilization protein AcuB
MNVKDVMTRDPFSIDPDVPLGTAMDVMRARAVRHLPVVDEAGQLIGIITDRDLRQACFAPTLAEYLSAGARRSVQQVGQTLADLKVREFMTWGVVTVHPDASLAHAALIMSERRVGSLPVIENGKLVGMLTERDLLEALSKQGGVLRWSPEGFLW